MNNKNYDFAAVCFVGNGKTLVLVSPIIALSNRLACVQNPSQYVSINDPFSKLNPFYFFLFLRSFLIHLIILTERLKTALMKIITAVTQYIKE